MGRMLMSDKTSLRNSSDEKRDRNYSRREFLSLCVYWGGGGGRGSIVARIDIHGEIKQYSSLLLPVLQKKLTKLERLLPRIRPDGQVPLR